MVRILHSPPLITFSILCVIYWKVSLFPFEELIFSLFHLDSNAFWLGSSLLQYIRDKLLWHYYCFNWFCHAIWFCRYYQHHFFFFFRESSNLIRDIKVISSVNSVIYEKGPFVKLSQSIFFFLCNVKNTFPLYFLFVFSYIYFKILK